MIARRQFITLLGGATAAWPLAASAQQRGRLPTIGFFSPNTRSAASPWTTAFVQQLHELGWIQDRTITIAYRFGEGRTDRIAEFVAEFVRLKVDVIVTHGEPNIVAAKQATSVIPIVFAVAADPIMSGFVASLSRPGGNITGLSIQAPDLAGKRIEGDNTVGVEVVAGMVSRTGGGFDRDEDHASIGIKRGRAPDVR